MFRHRINPFHRSLASLMPLGCWARLHCACPLICASIIRFVLHRWLVFGAGWMEFYGDWFTTGRSLVVLLTGRWRKMHSDAHKRVRRRAGCPGCRGRIRMLESPLGSLSDGPEADLTPLSCFLSAQNADLDVVSEIKEEKGSVMRYQSKAFQEHSRYKTKPVLLVTKSPSYPVTQWELS